MDEVKGVVVAATPEGPGHFGYHGRDTVRVEITSAGWKTTAKLKGAMQIYWREYGTRGHFRKGNTIKRYMRLAQQGEGGEPAFMVAHKAMGFAKRFVAFYYGKWWNG